MEVCEIIFLKALDKSDSNFVKVIDRMFDHFENLTIWDLE
jgi:hypothetical protein